MKTTLFRPSVLFIFGFVWLAGGALIASVINPAPETLLAAMMATVVLGGGFLLMSLAYFWARARPWAGDYSPGIASRIAESDDAKARRTVPPGTPDARRDFARLANEAHDRWVRYVQTIVAEIDLTEGTAEQRKELGHALQSWKAQHPEISEIKGLNELLAGEYPPFNPSGPIYRGMRPNVDHPIIIRSDSLPSEDSTHTKQILIRSLEARLPKATIRTIHVGQAFRGY